MGVSAVIPTRNRLQSLRRVLPTFLAQPEVEEVIVVIDGCTDGTKSFLEEAAAVDPRVRFIDNGVNQGLPRSRNIGIAAATREFVFMGEDDLELVDGYMTTLLAHLHSLEVDLIAGRAIYTFEDESHEEALRRWSRYEGPAFDPKSLTLVTSAELPEDTVAPIVASPMLGRTELFREIRYDDRFKVNFWREETDFQCSAQERGYRVGACPHAVAFNRMWKNDRGGAHSVQGLRRMAWILLNNWRFIRKHRQFLASTLGMVSPYQHFARFTLQIARKTVVIPALVSAKRHVVEAGQRVRGTREAAEVGS